MQSGTHHAREAIADHMPPHATESNGAPLSEPLRGVHGLVRDAPPEVLCVVYIHIVVIIVCLFVWPFSACIHHTYMHILKPKETLGVLIGGNT
jgi:hypothetical protein